MREKGFTLLEMLVVLSIMAMVVGMAAPKLTHAINRSKTLADQATANTIATAMQEGVIEGGEIKDTNNKWVEITEKGIFTDESISLSRYLDGIDRLKPKMNSSYVFYYKYNSLENKLEIGAGLKKASNNAELVYELYPDLSSEYK